MTSVRESASVTVSKAVDGGKKKPRKRTAPARRPAQVVTTPEPCPQIRAAVKAARRPGERIRVVSETEVWLEPIRTNRGSSTSAS